MGSRVQNQALLSGRTSLVLALVALAAWAITLGAIRGGSDVFVGTGLSILLVPFSVLASLVLGAAGVVLGVVSLRQGASMSYWLPGTLASAVVLVLSMGVVGFLLFL